MSWPWIVLLRRGTVGKGGPKPWSLNVLIFRRRFLCFRRKLRLLTLCKRQCKYIDLLCLWRLVWLNWNTPSNMQRSVVRLLLTLLRKWLVRWMSIEKDRFRTPRPWNLSKMKFMVWVRRFKMLFRDLRNIFGVPKWVVEQARKFCPDAIISTEALDPFKFVLGVTPIGGPDT